MLECGGTQESLETAIPSARKGGWVGFVGVPHARDAQQIGDLLGRAVGLRGSGAWVRHYLPALRDDVLAGRLDPSPVFDLEMPLEAGRRRVRRDGRAPRHHGAAEALT